MYDHIRAEMAQGHGIYIVCPFVEESDKVVSRVGGCQPAEPAGALPRQGHGVGAGRRAGTTAEASSPAPRPRGRVWLASAGQAPPANASTEDKRCPRFSPLPCAVATGLPAVPKQGGVQRRRLPCTQRRDGAPAHTHAPTPRPLPAQEEVKAATAEAERLVAEGHFEAADLGLLHGQLAPEEKEAVLQRFKAGHIKLLVR